MASKQRIPEEIRQEAARWITECDAGLLTPESEKAMAAWLRADPLHMAAYDRLEGTWNAMGSTPVIAAARQRSTVPPFCLPQRPPPWLGGAIAASLALLFIAVAQDWRRGCKLMP